MTDVANLGPNDLERWAADDPSDFDADSCIEQLAAGTAAAVRELGRRGAGRRRLRWRRLRRRRRDRRAGPSDPSTSSACAYRSATSATASSDLGLELADELGARTVEEPITAALEGLGCYARRDEAIREVFPDYEPNWQHKLVRSPPAGGVDRLLARRRASGRDRRSRGGCRRAPTATLLAATNMKQRVRKLLEYTWADRLGYAVIGTPNLLEYDQGFFVKGGDGLADVKPIARPLQEPGLRARPRARAAGGDRDAPADDRDLQPPADPGGVLLRPPVRAHGPAGLGTRRAASRPRISPTRVGLSADEVEAAYREIERRRVATEYLHAPAVIVDPHD